MLRGDTMNISDVEFCDMPVLIYDFPPSKRIYIEQLAKAVDASDFEFFLIVVDIQTNKFWNKRRFKTADLVTFQELSSEDYITLLNSNHSSYEMFINEKNHEAIYSYLKKDACVTFVDNSKKLSSYQCVGVSYSGIYSEQLERFLKQKGADFNFVGETFEVELTLTPHYKNLELKNKFNAKLTFKVKKESRIAFSWRPSAGAYLGEFSNGMKTKSLGFITINPEAAQILKSQFGKEPDSSYGNPKIANRMKKYLNL